MKKQRAGDIRITLREEPGLETRSPQRPFSFTSELIMSLPDRWCLNGGQVIWKKEEEMEGQTDLPQEGGECSGWPGDTQYQLRAGRGLSPSYFY